MNMVAMEKFRSRVAESAKAAAGAARQLSALDDMAQNDDYVHSEGLRVSEKKECASSASSYSENAEMPSVVEDLSGRFVDALSTSARKFNRPPERQTPPSQNLSEPSAPVEVAGKRRGKSKGEVKFDLTKPAVQHQPKSKPASQKPQLISSVAALYDQNDERKPPKQSKRNGNHKHRAHNKGGGVHESKPKIPGATNQSPSLATLPSSPGHHTNVLLVNERHAHIFHELDYDSADSSDDEQHNIPLNDDFELGKLGNSALHDQLEQELEESISRQSSLNGPANVDQGRDVNRFMRMTAGLELEGENEGLLPSFGRVPEPTPRNADRVESTNALLWAQDARIGTAGEETTKAMRAGLSWVRNVASPQLENVAKQIMTKAADVGKKKASPVHQPGRGPMIGPRHAALSNDASEEEKFSVSTSAAFLADDDFAELERIRARNSTSKIKALLQGCIDNPRLAFIAITLILAVFAYFWSRHKSVDDVL